jgi:hypothetical protein
LRYAIRTGLVAGCKAFHQYRKNGLGEIRGLVKLAIHASLPYWHNQANEADIGTPVAGQILQQPELSFRLVGPDSPVILIPIKDQYALARLLQEVSIDR